MSSSSKNPMRTDEPSLKIPLAELTQNVELTMSSLYNLQTALMNATDTDQNALRQVLAQLRQTLKVHWEDLLNYLKKCYAFGADCLLLTQALNTESRESCMEFLTDMRATAEELLTITNYVRQRADEVATDFAKDKAKFSKALQSLRPRLKNDVQHENRSSTPPNNNDNQEFVTAYLAARYPDGCKALAEVEIAMFQIKSSLEMIHHFWQFTSEQCRAFVVPTTRGRSITIQQATLITQTWKGYQEELLKAIVSITRTSDAILVEASGRSSVQRGASGEHRRGVNDGCHI